MEFEQARGDAVEEVAVVGDEEDGAAEAAEVVFEPVEGLGVEVVGGLVEQEEVGLLQQDAAEAGAAQLPAGEFAQKPFLGGDAEGVHCFLFAGLERVVVVEMEALLEFSLAVEEALGLFAGGGVLEFAVDAVEFLLQAVDVIEG